MTAGNELRFCQCFMEELKEVKVRNAPDLEWQCLEKGLLEQTEMSSHKSR